MHPHPWRRQLVGYLVTGATLILAGRGDRQDANAASIPSVPGWAGTANNGIDQGTWREVTGRLHIDEDLLPLPIPIQ